MEQSLKEAIAACWNCRHECQTTLFDYCLSKGKEHTEENHLKSMIDCIQMCQVCADFMTRHSNSHHEVCAACAVICEACAKSCATMKDAKMQACAKTCENCAKICRQMSKKH